LTVTKVLAAALRGPPVGGLSAHHWKTLNALLCCRTPMLGVHHYRCTDCKQDHIVPHSCRNRHCPECQGAAAMEWLERQEESLLEVPYFHVVFTLPHDLNPLILQNQRALHTLLFETASETLLSFGRNKWGVKLGITAVLHTWSQIILDHNHLHCIVSGGGLTPDGQHWRGAKGGYLFDLKALGIVFRAKYRDGLRKLHAKNKFQFHGQLAALSQRPAFETLLRKALRTPWVVYAKRPFAGPSQVLAYLSRYTHRIAIGNRRILAMETTAPGVGTVTFSYKDYADNARKKTMTLDLREFLRRFCMHILPSRFVKIRHYGLLANRGRKDRIARARALIPAPRQKTQPAPPSESKSEEIPDDQTAPARNPACPHCGSTNLRILSITRPPAQSLRRDKPATPNLMPAPDSS
jgi:DNA-directed RNA polymerase subunit RPC12/RpoP